MACLLALLTALPKQLRVEVAFCGQLANADELHHNRHARYCAAQLDICKIARVNADLFGQLPAGHFHSFTRLLNICSEGFKSRAIFYIRHITSPCYILLFIGCPGNDVVCAFDSFYNSYVFVLFRYCILLKINCTMTVLGKNGYVLG